MWLYRYRPIVSLFIEKEIEISQGNLCLALELKYAYKLVKAGISDLNTFYYIISIRTITKENITLLTIVQEKQNSLRVQKKKKIVRKSSEQY